MLYYLFQYLHSQFNFPGAGVFQYISFRAAFAIITSLIISLLIGKSLICYLQKKQVGEIVRDLGLEGQLKKQGTPTMGGIIILAAILIPTLLFAKLQNVYIIIMLVCTIWLGLIGFLDDYIKVFKKDKRGLAGKFKIAGQVILGLVVGLILNFSDSVTVRREIVKANPKERIEMSEFQSSSERDTSVSAKFVDVHSPITTIPFVKNHEFNYSKLLTWMNSDFEKYTWVLYILVVIFIITAVSNGANITDGIDGLAAGSSAIIGATLGVFAYVSGNINTANYLNIMYIPNSGELVIFLAALIGACIGFLWYNTYPA